MARKPIGYWEKRSTQLMKSQEIKTEKTINTLIQAYQKATHDINKEIVKTFNNYAKDGVLDKNTLKQLLTTKESDTYYKNLLSVINNNITDENIKKKLLAKYNAPAYAYRISRYEALQNNIDIKLKELANIEQEITKIRYVDTIKEGYYHNIYDTQKGLGLNFSFAQIDERTINLLLKDKWIDGGNFSQRIWQNSEKMNEYFKTNMTAAALSGKSINKISEELSDYMQVGLFQATRLVRTEVNHFANESEMLAYEELGIEKYQFIATLDARTCVHCGKMDGRIFNLKDKKAGVNYPPLHPNDRCTTVAVFDDEVKNDLQRKSRNPITNQVEVIDNISYDDWLKQYNISSNQDGIFITNNNVIYNTKTLNKLNNQLVQVNAKQIDNLLKKYPTVATYIKERGLIYGGGNKDGAIAYTSYTRNLKKIGIYLEDYYFKSPGRYTKAITKGINDGSFMPCSNKFIDRYAVTHEFGHVVETYLLNEYNINNPTEYREALTSTYKWGKYRDRVYNNIRKDIIDIAIKNNSNFNIETQLSAYGKTKPAEFFAECFANLECGKSNELGKAMKEYLERVL